MHSFFLLHIFNEKNRLVISAYKNSRNANGISLTVHKMQLSLYFKKNMEWDANLKQGDGITPVV